jgi:hypothetical protein
MVSRATQPNMPAETYSGQSIKDVVLLVIDSAVDP